MQNKKEKHQNKDKQYHDYYSDEILDKSPVFIIIHCLLFIKEMWNKQMIQVNHYSNK